MEPRVGDRHRVRTQSRIAAYGLTPTSYILPRIRRPLHVHIRPILMSLWDKRKAQPWIDRPDRVLGK
jgi:hypothetical protein